MKSIFVIALSLITIISINAQELVDDVISFSRNNYGGTARIQAIGGAQVSLGGDISSAASNPAGLGFIRTSTWSFTPSLNIHDAEARYLGTAANDFKSNFNFNQLGIAFSNDKGDIPRGEFKGGTFAINMSRTRNFHSTQLIEGRNKNNSILDFFIEDRGDRGPYGDAAFGKLLVTDFEVGNFDDDNRVIETNNVNNAVSIVDGDPYQSGTIVNKGAEYQCNLSWGGNYGDRLYFGGGLGIKSLRLERTESFTEDAFELKSGDRDPVINSLSLTETKKLDGTGVNATFGVIVRPHDMIRFGVSYTTPTYYNITEENEFSLGVNYNDYTLIDGNDTFSIRDQNSDRHLSDIVITEYGFKTPGKLSLGSSFFLGKLGFLSADVDFVNYASSRLRSNDFSPVQENDTLRNTYGTAINYRFGGEMRLDNLRIRGGYAFSPSAFKDNYKFQSSRSFSIGGGYRNADYYVDIVYVNTRSETNYSPYPLKEGSPTADIVNHSSNLAVTFGFNF